MRVIVAGGPIVVLGVGRGVPVGSAGSTASCPITLSGRLPGCLPIGDGCTTYGGLSGVGPGAGSGDNGFSIHSGFYGSFKEFLYKGVDFHCLGRRQGKETSLYSPLLALKHSLEYVLVSLTDSTVVEPIEDLALDVRRNSGPSREEPPQALFLYQGAKLGKFHGYSPFDSITLFSRTSLSTRKASALPETLP